MFLNANLKCISKVRIVTQPFFFQESCQKGPSLQKVKKTKTKQLRVSVTLQPEATDRK